MIPGRGDYQLIGTEDDPIPENEPVFIIRGQDALAFEAVMYYAFLCEVRLNNYRLAARVRAHAVRVNEWPTKKNPDLPADQPMHIPIKRQRKTLPAWA